MATERLAGGTRERVALRLRVALERIKLDAALAEGADSCLDPLLVLRARQLVAPRTRRAIANGIESVLKAAEAPSSGWRPEGSHPPVQRDDIVAASEVLRRLADRLREPGYLPVQGVALASLLVWDSASPFYAASAEESVAQIAHGTLGLLDYAERPPV